jgi:hypothetical protein
MLNAVKVVVQIAAGIVVGNAADAAVDKVVNIAKKVIEAKKAES